MEHGIRNKIIIFIIILVSYISISLSQDYIPFPEEDVTWTVSEFNIQFGHYDTYIYTIQGDTLVEGKNYKKVYQLSDVQGSHDTIWFLHNLMRQDTITKKIYFIRVYQGDSTEKLGYDFDVEIGDTINIPAFDYTNSGDSIFKVIHPVWDSTLLWNGEYRKNYHYSSLYPSAGYSIFAIEGVGTFRTPFPNLFYFDPFHQSETVCHIVNGEYLFGSNPLPEDCDFSVSVLEIISDNKTLAFPNPFTTSTTISFTLDAKFKIQISIFNTIGEEVFNMEDHLDQGTHQFSWSPHHLPAGLYFGVIKFDENVEVIKLLKQ